MQKYFTKFFESFVLHAICLLLAGTAQAATLNVCKSGCEYSTIQSAIDAASLGDTVEVDDGIYTENIDFSGKAITVQSVNGAATTIIDGNADGNVMVFSSNERSTSILDGFTIKNGLANYGGGIYCHKSSPTILNSTIASNVANYYGGGIYGEEASPTITNCTISSNSAYWRGGGIYWHWRGSPTVTNCTIKGNSAISGGGIACYDTSSLPTITNCTIIGNSASFGGGIACRDYSSPTITNCIISGNSASAGAGIYHHWFSSPMVTNCTISGNKASGGGGGIYCLDNSSPTLVNSILFGDTAEYSGNEVYLSSGGTYPSSITITYSNINSSYIAGIGTVSLSDNINADPLFVDSRPASEAPTSDGNYHLEHGSPCIDTGTDDTATYPTLPSNDIDDDTRPKDGDGNSIPEYDMGADEYVVCTDVDNDGYFTEAGCGVEVDCDDSDNTMYPSARELCDGKDNDCDGQVDEECGQSVYKGMTYASWTQGDYPYSPTWKPQDWQDSQAIEKVYITTKKHYSGNGSLAMETQLIGQDDNKGKGETFVDLRYHAPICTPPDCVITPIDLDGLEISARVYCPSGSQGNPSAPNGIQFFAKDENWNSFYGNWANVSENNWNLVTATPSTTKPEDGYVHSEFNPTKIISVGVKIAINDNSNDTFTGTFYLDDVNWSGGCEPKYGFENIKNSLDAIKNTGSNYVSLIVTWYMDTLESNEIYSDSYKSHTDEEIKETIDYIHGLGMQVMLKPHVDIQTNDWRGYINPSDKNAWWASHNDFILHYAQIAKEKNVKLFCVGTELKSMSGADNQSEWLDLIVSIRNDINYQGELTYAANHDEYESVSFWDAIDLIGIDAYFSLSEDQSPLYSELIEGWQPYIEAIETWRVNVGKPVVFTEIGYSSHSGAAKEPWLTCDRLTDDGCTSYDYDCELQANCYQAAFEVLGNKTWFEGMFWWAWLTDSAAGGCCNTSFTPQNKPAKEVLRLNYCSQDGDVNQDGSVTPADALLAFQHYLGLIELDGCQQAHADVNNDGSITPSDALCVFQKYLGLPSCLDSQ